jgi:hypothetical protein
MTTVAKEPSTMAEQEKIAATIRRIVTPRFVTGQAALFDGGGTAADKATASLAAAARFPSWPHSGSYPRT